jgi:hypothetical protein
MKTSHSDLLEWLTASTGIGVFDFSKRPMERRDYDGFQTTKLMLEYSSPGKRLCYAVTQPTSKYHIVNTFNPSHEHLQSISLNAIERSVYNEQESEEIVREIVAAFIRETGVVRMKVHVCKRLFQSNNKATVAVLVEEIFG